MGVHVSTDDLVPRHGQGKPALAFSPCKVLSRLTCFSSAGPSPFPSFSGAGHQEADLGRRGQNSCWFSSCCGTGASHPEAVAQCQGLGRRGAKLAAPRREGMLLLPFKSPPRLLLLPPPPSLTCHRESSRQGLHSPLWSSGPDPGHVRRERGGKQVAHHRVGCSSAPSPGRSHSCGVCALPPPPSSAAVRCLPASLAGEA